MIGSNPFPQPFGSPLPGARPKAPVKQNPQPREAGMPRFINYLAD